MGRKYLEECCCVLESLYSYESANTSTNDRFDVKANAVELAHPTTGQGAAIYYATASPPTGHNLESVARVKVWDQVEATLTAKLVARNMPAEWFSTVGWNYDTSGNASGGYSPFNPSFGAPSYFPYVYNLDLNTCAVPTTYVYFNESANDRYVQAVEGFTDFPEPSQGSISANTGTSLSQLAAPARGGLGNIVLYCADMGLRTTYAYNQVDGGFITSPFPNNWPGYNFAFPMQSNGFDSSFFLSMEGQSRWVICTSNDSPGSAYPYYGLDEATQPGRRRLAWLTLYVATYLPGAAPGDVSETCFVTSYTHRPNAQFILTNTGRYRNTAAYPIRFFDVTHESSPPRNANAWYNYTNTTVKQFQGNEITVYRNGTQVLSAHYPTIEQSRAATQEEGTYLIVNEYTGASDDPSTPEWYNHNIYDAMHKAFQCVVIDKTPPVVAFEAMDDFYGTTTANYSLASVVIPTEPIRRFAFAPVDLDDAGILISGVRIGSFSGGGTGPRERTISPPSSELWDLAGNLPERVMSHPLKIHDYPLNVYMPGAKPRLSKFESRTRTQNERVRTVELAFDRKINPAGVTASQFTLDKNNERVEGLTVEPIGDGSLAWRVTIPLDIQTSRSFFVLTYNPGGNVYTDDWATVRAVSRGAFPATGQYKTRYVYADDNGVDRWFSWSFTGYVSIAEGEPPLFPFGGYYVPEPTVLAARTSWIMADMNGRPREIDCGSTQYLPPLGRVASIGVSKTIDTTKTASEVQSNEPGKPAISYDPRDANPQYGRINEVKFKRYENRRSFIPAVPSPTSPRAGCSWFGCTTTIDPSPPAAVHSCAAPSEHQKHSSVIISDDEITSFIVSLEMRDTNGNIAQISVDDSAYQNDFPWSDGNDIGNPGDAARKIMAASGAEYTLGTTLQGRPLSQNVWGCIEGARSGEYASRVIVTDQPIPCPENGKKYYTYAMTENGGTTFARGSRQGKTRKLQAVFTQDGVQATLTASRQSRTYPSLYTTVLGELRLSFSLRMAVKRTTTYTEYGVGGNPVGYRSVYNSSICPSTLYQPGSSFASNFAVYAESQMQQIGQPKTVVSRFFDYVSGGFHLSKLDEIALGQGQTIRKELFGESYDGFGRTSRIWTLKIRKG